MAGRIDIVEEVVADCIVFPAHGIVQGMGADIPPVAIQTELLQGGLGTSQLKQLIGCQQGCLF
jgi:hypothetical protein